MILITGVIALLFSGVIGYIIAISFLQPIRRLTEAMHIIEKDPESRERIDVGDGNDELTELCQCLQCVTLDRMQRNIEQHSSLKMSRMNSVLVAVVEGHMKLFEMLVKTIPLFETSHSARHFRRSNDEEPRSGNARSVTCRAGGDPLDKMPSVRELVNQTQNNFQLVHPDFTFILDDDLYKETHVNIYRNHLEGFLLFGQCGEHPTDYKVVHLSVSNNGPNIQIAIQDFGGRDDGRIDVCRRFSTVSTV
ncbi:MAG: hypothetical protein U5K84_07285 [Alkalibacterium sp.]|nr:hypothetical protein [Alkalibacterium sp.]